MTLSTRKLIEMLAHERHFICIGLFCMSSIFVNKKCVYNEENGLCTKFKLIGRSWGLNFCWLLFYGFFLCSFNLFSFSLFANVFSLCICLISNKNNQIHIYIYFSIIRKILNWDRILFGKKVEIIFSSRRMCMHNAYV